MFKIIGSWFIKKDFHYLVLILAQYKTQACTAPGDLCFSKVIIYYLYFFSNSTEQGFILVF